MNILLGQDSQNYHINVEVNAEEVKIVKTTNYDVITEVIVLCRSMWSQFIERFEDIEDVTSEVVLFKIPKKFVTTLFCNQQHRKVHISVKLYENIFEYQSTDIPRICFLNSDYETGVSIDVFSKLKKCSEFITNQLKG